MRRTQFIVWFLFIPLLLTGCSDLLGVESTESVPTENLQSAVPTAGAVPLESVTTTPTVNPAVEEANLLLFQSTRNSADDLYAVNADGSGLLNVTDGRLIVQHADWAPDGNQIAFAGRLSDEDTHDIYLFDIESQTVEATNLTTNTRDSLSPTWSADGRWLMYVAREPESEQATLRLLDVETQETSVLLGPMIGLETPAWSPNGSQVVFAATFSGDHELYVFDVIEENDALTLDRSSMVNLTNNLADDRYPSWSPDNTRIAFTSDRNGDPDIFVMNANGTSQVGLTEDPALDIQPSWAADGQRLAFATNRDGNFEIYTMTDSGAELTNITNNVADDLRPTWQRLPPQPFSERLLFSASILDEQSNIYAINPSGSNLTALTTDPLVEDTTPNWSSDGKQIAFASNRNGNMDIFVADDNGVQPDPLVMTPGRDIHPAWSPDDAWIGFETNRDGNWEIYMVRNDGTGLTNLTNHPSNDGNIAWAPNGSEIAFVSDRDSNPSAAAVNLDIYLMNTDGSNLRRLTNHPGKDVFPSWSPDGQYLVFRSDRNGNNEIYRISRHGTELRRLTANTVNDDQPTWSPSGDQIAFVSTQDNAGSSRGLRGFLTVEDAFDIYVMSAEGGQPTRVTDSTASERYPRWLPSP